LKAGDLEPFNLGMDLSDTKSADSKDIAYALQEYTNRYLHGILDFWIKLADTNGLVFDDIGFAGGLSLSIVATSYAARKKNLSNIVIPPFPNDSGLAF